MIYFNTLVVEYQRKVAETIRKFLVLAEDIEDGELTTMAESHFVIDQSYVVFSDGNIKAYSPHTNSYITMASMRLRFHPLDGDEVEVEVTVKYADGLVYTMRQAIREFEVLDFSIYQHHEAFGHDQPPITKDTREII